ncbi:hypothetical protein N183_37490 [Sinorhizobium sp. Sb3]|uniref:hypothetical protein n=1 Tax=Sinorhizobium sp. Sb3 TaxID=1358417 RepID=UPI00071DFD39|nr:hypothetical protein [Sinorhizobium sp. Sb3]KSV60791.1 hypothetical protein N183_37490 [Sinorhizobium sp. Sb3]
MAAIVVDEKRYADALSHLDEDARSWVEHAIPDAIAERFAAAAQIVLCADFHRPVRSEDAELYSRNTYAPVWLTFVTPGDMDRGWSRLGNPTGVCCHHTEYLWNRGELQRIPGSTIEERCRHLCPSQQAPKGHFVILLSFDGIQKELVEAVKDLGGVTIVVEDKQREAKDLIDPDNYDMRCPADIQQDILESLFALRRAYQTRPLC